jgi:ferredoxin-NADP reductase
LHDTVVPGTELTVAAPGGAFTLTAPAAGSYLFLSAGSGITPLMSMTRTLVDLGADADIAFVHSARTPADIVFRRELDAHAAVVPGLTVTHVCEDDHPCEVWTGSRGRLSTALLTALVPDLHERTVYTCGPVPYMAAVREILDGLRYDMAGYHEESFVFPTTSAGEPSSVSVPPESPTQSADGFAVEFTKAGRTVTCAPDQTILDAALRAGIRVASACGEGMCGTCKSSLLCGEVDMNHNGGIRPREIRAGKILLCCSTPKGDLQIEQ